MTQDTQAAAGAQPAPALQPEALRIAMHLRQRAQLSRSGDLDTLSTAGANELERQHAELEARAAAKSLHQGTEPAHVTYMSTDNACKWAWDQVRKDVGTEGWTTSESCNFYGFFMWGWHYRGQYETQRPAAPAAPAAVAVQPAALESSILDLEAWEDRSDGEPMTLSETESVSLVLQELKRLRALAAAPAQAVAVPDWDGKLPERLQCALNALRLECPPAIVADVEHEVRSHYDAMHTSLTTVRRMYGAARGRLDALDAAHPDPFATPAQEHATQLAGQGQTFAQWWDEQRKTAAERAPGDDWMDLNADDRDQYEAAFSAGKESAAPAQAQEDARDAVERAERYEDALRHIAENAFANKDWTFAQLILNGHSIDAARAAQGGAA